MIRSIATVFVTVSLLAVPVTTQADPVQQHLTESKWANSAPHHGKIGKYQDSNVRAVWEGIPSKIRLIWKCIRNHESVDYHAPNKSGSGATGAGQWTGKTWTGLKEWVIVEGEFVAKQYRKAMDAPAWVQDAAFLHVYKRDQKTGRGMEMWNGTHCPGT